MLHLVLPALALALPAAPPVADAGFEAADPRAAWQAHVYGAPSQVALDASAPHGGRQALRIGAAEPSDTALGQEAALAPKRHYRLSGWVRTRGLRAITASTLGALQVQTPGGGRTLAATPNRSGDTPWTEVACVFRAPDDGRVRLCVFFAGFGTGVGEAWFDDIRLEEVDPKMTDIAVTATPACPGRISPLQYGQFIEYLCDLVPGIWAERLDDTSFEGLTPYRFAHIAETDFRQHPWHPAGATHRAQWTSDTTDPVAGAKCRKIEATGATPCVVGLAQDGVYVDRGERLRFSCWMRADGLGAPVRVRIRGEKREYASAAFTPGARWARHEAWLTSSGRDTAATLVIEFTGPGTLWLDSASLMPEKTVGGWRPDVVEAIRALKPGVIRNGGSVVDYSSYGGYDWRKTIGDPDRRTPFDSWGGLQPTGAGLEELVQLTLAVGAEPIMCVRFNGSTPEEAAAQVEYFNGAPDTPMGRLRAANGHPEPYGLRLWQVGNEVQSEDYDARVAAFCRAMKGADPSIELLSSYPTAKVFATAGDLLDFACPHHYGCHDLAGMDADFRNVRRTVEENAPGRKVRIAVTEWNTTAGENGTGRAMLWTLENALACARYHNLMHRHADTVEIACRSNLVNSFCSGIIQTDSHRLYKTPTYYAQQLYASLGGTRPLQVTGAETGPDISATLSEDGRELTLFAVNDTTDDLERTLDLSALGVGPQRATVWTVADRERAGQPDVTNGWGDPERIAARRSGLQVAGARAAYRFPALSLTVLRFRAAAR